MKITRIRLYKTGLPYVGGSYGWGRGNAIEIAQASVVVLDTDAGLQGCGEFTPCGENYIEAHSEGVEAAARLLAPRLLGEDPRQLGRIEGIMDHVIRGHGYAKSPFDIACWDILGQSVDQPLWMLLGGWLADGAPLYRVAPQKPVPEMVAEMAAHRATGYLQFQVKVGADWSTDIHRIRQAVTALAPGEKAFADANQGWRVDEALRVARATRDLDYFFEQPCRTYEECQQVRRRTDLPMKLDECITDMEAVTRVAVERGAEVVCLKISKQGGLSKARRMRDFLVDHRIPVVCEDTWGGEITTAAVAHFACSTPAEFLVNATDLHNYNTRSTGTPAPRVEGGRLYASTAPGLGVAPDFESLGAPVARWGAAA
ncbi:MAG: mandelate racemase/muconate lactonizing enzyme family protein [Pseudomonadota bacterium]